MQVKASGGRMERIQNCGTRAVAVIEHAQMNASKQERTMREVMDGLFIVRTS